MNKFETLTYEELSAIFGANVGIISGSVSCVSHL